MKMMLFFPLLFEKELFRCVWKSCFETIVSTVATFIDMLSQGKCELSKSNIDQTNKQTNKQTYKLTNKQTYKQTNLQTNKHFVHERPYISEIKIRTHAQKE